MVTTVVSCENLWKVYNEGSANEVKALRGVTLRIRKGEFVAIMGPSGSGKSTLLHLLGCLDRATKGKVLIDGIDTSELSEDELARIRREKIGFVFQFFHLIPTLTAMENVMLPMSFAGVSRERQVERAKKLLRLVGLEKRADHLPSQLSGGEQQRVAIARALANSPKIILADEPTGNLDSKSGEEILNLLKKINEENGVTIAVVTHDATLAKFANRVIFMKDGKIIKEKVRKG